MQNGKIATKEKIWAAANELTAEGKKATLVAVRKRIGGGSYTDISEAMEAWRSNNQSLTPANETTSNLPNEQLNEFGAEIFAAVMEFANGRLREEQEELERVKQKNEKTHTEDIRLIYELTYENNRLETTLKLLKEQLKQVLIEHENLKVVERACQASLDAAMCEIDALKTQSSEEISKGKPATEIAVDLSEALETLKNNAATEKKQKLKNRFKSLDRKQRTNKNKVIDNN